MDNEGYVNNDCITHQNYHEEDMPRGNDDTNFTSRLPRRVFACPGEEYALLSIIKFAIGRKLRDSDEEKNVFTGKDYQAFCSQCRRDIKNDEHQSPKVVKALRHTSHHGTIAI